VRCRSLGGCGQYRLIRLLDGGHLCFLVGLHQMITPDLPLARAITAAVMDQIERSRTISSSGIEEVVYAKLLYANAVAGEAAPSPDRSMMLVARKLVNAVCSDPHYVNPVKTVIDVLKEMDVLLRRHGQ
jgi:hypothetical protein